MKLSTKKFKVKNPEKLKHILEEEKIEKALDDILEKVQNNPEEMLLQEEIDLLKSNVSKLQAVKSFWIVMMIKATRDKDFIVSCLEDENFELDEYSKQELIIATCDKEYIIQHIEEAESTINFKFSLLKSLPSVMNEMEYMTYVTGFIKNNTQMIDSFYKKELISSVSKHPGMDIDTYILYLEGRLDDETMGLTNRDKIELISKLQELEPMQKQTMNKAGTVSLRKYEWTILRYLRENQFNFNELEKCQLIGSAQNIKFYNICLHEKGLLNSVGKANLIQQFRNLDGVTEKQYLNAVRQVIQNESFGLENAEKCSLIRSIREIDLLNEKSVQLSVGDGSIDISEYDRLVSMAILDTNQKINLTSREKANLLSSISNNDIIDLFVSNSTFRGYIDAEDKADVILSTNDEEYIRKCIDDKKIYLGLYGRVGLIKSLKDKSKIREYIEEKDGLLDGEDKVDLMLETYDEAYIKTCLENPEINLSPVERAKVIIKGIADEQYIRNCLNDEVLGNNLAAKDMIINARGTEAEKQEWQTRLVNVTDISSISSEALETLPDDTIIKTEDVIFSFYTKQEYLQVRQKMDELLEGIDMPTKGDERSEIAAFLEISKRLARHISYDNDAISEGSISNYELQKESRNLYGGLINGKCVCAGYATILKNALACLGIESKYVSGENKIGGAGHAWNQVKIGDAWYNVDLTWERNEIVRTGTASQEILKSDKEFANHNKYKVYEATPTELCIASIKDRDLSDTRFVSQPKKANYEEKDEI